MPGHGQPGCLVLYSGGLDSILACRVLQEQGIRVTAVRFITPFFGQEVAGREDEFKRSVWEKYSIRLEIIDITDDYLPMLRNPPHGYGKNFNPCIDCKILMVQKALELLPAYHAGFIATGEVIGQRPMSQRRDTLNCITNDSNAAGLLLRPLCARSLKPTIPEQKGWVARESLPHISGRGRKIQIELAEKYGITDYPNPGGGCVLADPIQGRRLRRYFSRWPAMDGNDCYLALTGRQFHLRGGWWLVIGRDKRENKRLSSLCRKGDMFLDSRNAPAPSGILRNPGQAGQLDISPSEETVSLSASIILHYCRKCSDGLELLTTWGGVKGSVIAEQAASAETVARFALDE